jgi:hypothetical protein
MLVPLESYEVPTLMEEGIPQHCGEREERYIAGCDTAASFL